MDTVVHLVYASIGAISIFFFFVRISLLYWKQRGILHEKPKFLWGNLKGVGKKQHISTTLQHLYEKYKGKAPFIGFYAYLKPMVLVLDMDLMQNMLLTDANYFMERGLYHNVRDDPLSGNLMQLDGKKWDIMRENLKQCFSKDKINIILPTLERVADIFKQTLASKNSLNDDVYCINEIVACYNEDVISSLAFGQQSDSVRYSNAEFRIMTRGLWKNFSILQTYLAINFPYLARLFQYRTFDQKATAYYLRIINDKVTSGDWYRSEGIEHFLSYFARLHRPGLSTKEIAAQSFSFILAGLDACNSTLTFCLYELALQPEIQKRAREEIVQALENHGHQLTGSCLSEMNYLRQILHETLRKHCPYPVLLRNTTKDYEIPNSVFMLQKNNHAIIPIAALHNDPSIYNEPQKFDPDRFTEIAVKKRSPIVWMPFGCGPRNCIARELAELQMIVGLVTLLRDYEWSPCGETAIPLEYDYKKLLLTPKGDVKLRATRV